MEQLEVLYQCWLINCDDVLEDELVGVADREWRHVIFIKALGKYISRRRNPESYD